jgi:hypothetical protein
MAMVLTGFMNGMRVVGGVIEEGKRKGEKWAFLSMEIVDPRYGKVYSCQLRHDDPQYSSFVSGERVSTDLTGHKVKVTVKSMTAGPRTIEDKATGEVREIIQIRSLVTNLRDLGTADDDE